jgi:aminodeoxychorismate lyase
MIVFLNGQFVPELQAVVPVNDRGFMYGDGLFETMRVCNGRPFRMAQHLERMTRGADFLKIKCPFTPGELQNFAGQLIGQNQMPEAVLRVMLTRGPGERGYTPQIDSQPTVVMTLHTAPGAPASGTARSDPSLSQAVPEAGAPIQWRLITSSYRIPAGDPLSSFKTANKLIHIMARMEAVEKDADEALLVNTNGEVAETASGNLFWVYQDNICTVPTGRGVLPGITREVVLEICQTLGLPVNKRIIKPEALRNSEGIFITQSALGIVPVTTLDGEPVAPSPLLDPVLRAYHEMLAKP